MNMATSLVGALGAFGALAYLMAPLPPEAPPARIVANVITEIAAGTDLVRAASDNPSMATARVLPPSAPPQDPSLLLVRQLQTELLRLGCYDGAIDGQWSAEARQAMHDLGERVRVLRPVDTPDYIMLALARSQESHICVPHGKATASRQPVRLVPMAGLVPIAEALTASNEGSRRIAPPTRSAEPVPSRHSARRDADVAMRTADRPSSEVARAESLPYLDRATLEQSRMSLGVATGDPVRADADPRDPTAPAVLLGPSLASSATAARSETGQDELDDQDAIRTLQTASARALPSAPSRSRKRAWTRTFFSEMDKSGP